MKKRVWIIFLIGWGLGVVGCGYRLQGASAPGATIEVPVFENRTIETGIEALVTDRVIEELRRTPGWRVVPPGQGRYVLTGTVVKFISDPHIVSSREHLAVEHRARLFVDVRLHDQRSGKVLWRERALRSFADYPVGSDILSNERGKRLAIARIAEELATRIRVHIQDTW